MKILKNKLFWVAAVGAAGWYFLYYRPKQKAATGYSPSSKPIGKNIGNAVAVVRLSSDQQKIEDIKNKKMAQNLADQQRLNDKAAYIQWQSAHPGQMPPM